jgi:predicted nucleic acid-binding Zn ribbon protein
MQNPKSPCLACLREDRDHCAESCQDLARYRRMLDAMDPDEAARARRARVLDLGVGALSALAAGLDRST